MVDHPLRAEAEFLAERQYDASDPEAVNKARKKAARKTRELLDFTNAILASKEGRQWMYELLTLCKTYESPIVPGDPHYTYHNIGEQNIGRKLLQDINLASPDGYSLMLREAAERNL